MSKKLCLIVDDDRSSRLFLSEVLIAHKLDVEEVSDGWQALELCKNRMPDLILLDWMMPHMNGIQFLEEIRKDSIQRPPMIALCSSRFSEKDIKKGLESGADEYLKKPLRMRDIDILLNNFNKRNSLN